MKENEFAINNGYKYKYYGNIFIMNKNKKKKF